MSVRLNQAVFKKKRKWNWIKRETKDEERKRKIRKGIKLNLIFLKLWRVLSRNKYPLNWRQGCGDSLQLWENLSLSLLRTRSSIGWYYPAGEIATPQGFCGLSLCPLAGYFTPSLIYSGLQNYSKRLQTMHGSFLLNNGIKFVSDGSKIDITISMGNGKRY